MLLLLLLLLLLLSSWPNESCETAGRRDGLAFLHASFSQLFHIFFFSFKSPSRNLNPFSPSSLLQVSFKELKSFTQTSATKATPNYTAQYLVKNLHPKLPSKAFQTKLKLACIPPSQCPRTEDLSILNAEMNWLHLNFGKNIARCLRQRHCKNVVTIHFPLPKKARVEGD